MRPTGKLIAITILVVLLLAVKGAIPFINESKTYSQKEVFNYLKSETRQNDVFSAAMDLNGGTSSNACVYFVSEVLRRNKVSVPKDTCNTEQIISILEKKNWQKGRDYTQLKPGDLCFTTDHLGNKKGIPTHTYIFMGWVEEGNYDYAYICDNQAKDYEDKVYHIRNIKIVDTANGFSKDAFSFYMRPSI